jgi:hypothetical protein
MKRLNCKVALESGTAEIVRLQSRIKRLERGLEIIISLDWDNGLMSETMRTIAREALKEK